MNSLQKDKPAPTSRNFNKMRNRLRGILKKKREVEEYFEYHPDTTSDQCREESQPQVEFQFESSRFIRIVNCTSKSGLIDCMSQTDH